MATINPRRSYARGRSELVLGYGEADPPAATARIARRALVRKVVAAVLLGDLSFFEVPTLHRLAL
jgi:hypothetical protein